MKTEILIVTYAADIPYLVHGLRSIKKFATGFSGTTLVVPVQEKIGFDQLAADFGATLRTYVRDADKAKWHLHAQCMKCYGDLMCPGADFVLHTDSDCIFSEPVTPDDYLIGNKPVMLIEEYARIPTSPWKAVVENVLRLPAKYETMRRHPQVNPVGVYADLRTHIERVHGMPFTEYVLSLKPTFPWGFTEHNVIGSFAISDARWADKYHWMDVATMPRPRSKLIQFWSLSPPDKIQDDPSGGPRTVPIDIINRILG